MAFAITIDELRKRLKEFPHSYYARLGDAYISYVGLDLDSAGEVVLYTEGEEPSEDIQKKQEEYRKNIMRK